MIRIVAICVLLASVSIVQAQPSHAIEADPTRRAALVSVTRPEGVDDASWQREVATHATMLAHDATIGVALADEKSLLRATKWFAAQADVAAARQWLRGHLRAEPVPHTRLVRVYLDERLASPADEAALLESIVNTYLVEQSKAAQGKVLDRVQALTSLKTKYEIRIRELSDKQNNLMLRMNIGRPGTANVYTTTDLEFREAMNRESALRATEGSSRARYNEIEAAIKAGKDPQAVLEMIERDPELLAARARLLELEIDATAESAGNDANAAKTIAAKRDAVQALLEKRSKEKLERARTAVLVQAEADARAASIALEMTHRRTDELKGVMGDLAIAMSDYLSVNEELKLTRIAAKELRDQLDRYSADVHTLAIQWAQHPLAMPEQK